MATPPLIHAQSDCLAWMRRRDNRGAVFMEPGLGKTRVGFELAKTARRTLVFAPLNPVEFVWPEQQKQWAPDVHFRVVRGTPKERARILFDEKPEVAVINYELAHWFYDEVARRRKQPYELCLLDEATAAKNPASIAFRVLQNLHSSFDAVVPMAGTPAENSLADIWAPLWMVDEGRALGKRIGVFRERYCSRVLRDTYVSWKVSRARELREAAAPLCFVRRAVDCLDMPPLVHRDIWFELGKRERFYYEEMRREGVIPFDEPLPLVNAGVELDKVRQVSSGFVYDDERRAHMLGTSKADALDEALEESFGQPQLIGFWYQGSKQAIYRKLGYECATIDRHTSKSQKEKYLRMWAQGKLRVLLGQIKTVALGLNMQSPKAGVIFYDMPWSHGLYWQFIRRIWRQGQATRVVVRRLIARATADGYVAASLRRKQIDEEHLIETILNFEDSEI
jgi:SNF2 family DNA or RNA helicase